MRCTSRLRALPIATAFLILLPMTIRAAVVSIPASALLPKDPSFVYSSNGVNFVVPPASGAGYFLAPVFLPHRSRIKSMTLEAHDNSGGEFGGYVKVELGEYQYNTFLTLATADTTIQAAPGDTREPVTGLNHVVDNLEFSYGLGVTINNPTATWEDLKFFKVVIEYDLTELSVLESASPHKVLLSVSE